MASGQIRAGKVGGAKSIYPKDLVEMVKRSYLIHKVLGYKSRHSILTSLAQEFGIDSIIKVAYILDYAGIT